MLILLPPSEGKSSPKRGPKLTLRALAFRELDGTRAAVMAALIALCASDSVAMRTLGLGASLRDEVARNRELEHAPCGPAIDVYTGVLYEALGAGSLTPAQRTRLHDSVAIGSALWGLVRPLDPIPAYRLSGDTALKGVGALRTTWRDPVTAALASVDGPVLDLRSATYQFGVLPDRHDVAVGRVLLERGGKRSVVSHHNKATKGRAVRAFALSRKRPRTLEDALDILEASGIRCEVRPSAKGPAAVDLVTREL